MSHNNNLHKAKKAKNDEFYTQLKDIENELKHYEEYFKDKVVYCNCDTEESNFYKYFTNNYTKLKLKGLHRTSYDEGIDFRSNESIAILKECDIVVTNPPFSLFREYVAQLIEYDKKFLIIGNMNATTNKEIFPLIKDNKIWLGFTSPKEFKKPDDEIQKFGNICWFTNIKHLKRNEDLILYRKYSAEDYPKYDNYDAINVNKVKDIPMDYVEVTGVPITFLSKYNPEQFEIIWQASGNTRTNAPKEILEQLDYHLHSEDRGGCPIVNGNRTYSRILIKKK